MSVSIGATSLWSSFSILEVRLSIPAALPGFSFESCFDTPFTVIFMLGMVGDMSLRGRISSARCFSFNGTSFVKTDWNWPSKIFALSEAFVYVKPFDFKEVISLLSDLCRFISVQKRLLGLVGCSAFSGWSVIIECMYWLYAWRISL